jgi:hypothetical protein
MHDPVTDEADEYKPQLAALISSMKYETLVPKLTGVRF